MPSSNQRGVLAELRTLDPYEFEHLVARLWQRQGWQTDVVQQSNDYGIDVVAERQDPVKQRQLIQAKRYGAETRVGRPEIQQYASLPQQDVEADSVVVVTTGDFTSGAREMARELNVKLIDGQELVELMRELDAVSFVDADLTPGTGEKAASAVSSIAGLAGEALDGAAADGGTPPSEKLEELFRVIVMLIIIGALLWTLGDIYVL